MFYPTICFSSARPFTLSEILTIAIVVVVLVVLVVGGVIACVVRAYSSTEGLEPLLGDHYRCYSEEERLVERSKSVV